MMLTNTDAHVEDLSGLAADVVLIDSSNMQRTWANWACDQYELDNPEEVLRVREVRGACWGSGLIRFGIPLIGCACAGCPRDDLG